MPCVHPLAGHWGPGGRVYFDGRGWRDRPISVPCGKCVGCRTVRANSWALRCQHEASLHPTSSFVTLTYSPQQLPPDWSLQHGAASSRFAESTWDLQRFFKRLRKAVGPVRYLACGEYGTENLRPHYHAILFGVAFPDQELIREGECPLYTSRQLERLWTHGFVTVGSVNFQTAAYVAKYSLKAVDRDSPYYRRTEGSRAWSVRPEFSVMSRRPGIGAGWFSKFKADVFPSDEVIHEGRPFRPPRFYETKLSEGELREVKAKRLEWLAKHSERTSWSQLEAHEYNLQNRGRARGL